MNWIKLLSTAGALAAISLAGTAQAEDVITLGAAVSLTGKYSTNGKNTQDGYNLAVERVNSMGGVKVGDKTYKLAVKYYDDESTPARGAQLVERLINQDGIKLMLGPYSSGLTKAVAPVTEKYKIPQVEANGADRGLFTEGYKYLFAVLSTSDYYLREAVNLAAEQAKAAGKDPADVKIAIAIENDPFSADVRLGVMEDAEKHGMQIVIDDKLPPELNDMTSTLTKVKALKPDLLVVSAHAKGPPLALRQMSEMKVNVPMLAMTHCDSADIIGKFEKLSEYALCATQWDASLSYEDKWFGKASDFAADFEKAYGYFPPYQAAESAAAVLVYADALARAGSLESEAVRDALAETDMMTFYGAVKFDETGKNTAKPMVLWQVQDGAYKVVAPAKYADSKLIYPMPTWDERGGS